MKILIYSRFNGTITANISKLLDLTSWLISKATKPFIIDLLWLTKDEKISFSSKQLMVF